MFSQGLMLHCTHSSASAFSFHSLVFKGGFVSGLGPGVLHICLVKEASFGLPGDTAAIPTTLGLKARRKKTANKWG